MLSERQRIADVDATFMRTCRSVYDETMPILYGNNVFLFDNPDGIEQFRSRGLEHVCQPGTLSCSGQDISIMFEQCSILNQQSMVALLFSDISCAHFLHRMTSRLANTAYQRKK